MMRQAVVKMTERTSSHRAADSRPTGVLQLPAPLINYKRQLTLAARRTGWHVLKPAAAEARRDWRTDPEACPHIRR